MSERAVGGDHFGEMYCRCVYSDHTFALLTMRRWPANSVVFATLWLGAPVLNARAARMAAKG